MAYSIIWTKEAQKSLEKIFVFWKEHNASKEYSSKILQDIRSVESLLMNSPAIGQKYLRSKEEFRAISILKKFRLFYKIEQDKIIIIGFLSNAMLIQIEEGNLNYDN